MLPAEMPSTSEGNSFVLQDSGEQAGTVLVFMIPWCESYLENTRPAASASCRQVREQIEGIKQQATDIRWLGINSGLSTMAGDLPKYTETYHTTIPLALDADGRLFRAFGVMSVPTIIVADESGRIVRRVDGYDATLEEAVSAL